MSSNCDDCGRIIEGGRILRRATDYDIVRGRTIYEGKIVCDRCAKRSGSDWKPLKLDYKPVKHKETCKRCDGSGRFKGYKCMSCDGTGTVEKDNPW